MKKNNNGMQPLLSILVPIYNVSKYLERSINSIMNQTYENIEVICVDDGSTDNSLNLLLKMQEKDSRISIIHKRNGGLVSARKAAMKKARGKYIGYVDSDDWIEPSMYKELMDVAILNDSDVVCCGHYRDYGTHTVVEKPMFKDGTYTIEEILDAENGGGLVSLKEVDKFNISVNLVNKIFRKEIIYENQMKVPESISDGEDIACLWPTFVNCKKVSVISKCLYHYCLRDDSISFSTKEESYEELFRYLDRAFYISGPLNKTVQDQKKVLKSFMLLLGNPRNIIKYSDELLIPYGRIRKKSKIIVYGQGRFAKQLADIVGMIDELEMVGVIDKYSKNDRILDIHEINDTSYDVILIGILKSDTVREVKKELIDSGIPESKLLSIKIDLLKCFGE